MLFISLFKMYNPLPPPQNFFIDSESGLQLEAEVLPNDISQPASPGDGQPQISDHTLDFLVRQASPVSTQVGGIF